MNLATTIPKNTLTHAEAAAYLGVSTDTIERWALSCGLPYVQPGGPGSTRLYSVRLLDDWVERQHTLSIKTPSQTSPNVVGLGPWRPK